MYTETPCKASIDERSRIGELKCFGCGRDVNYYAGKMVESAPPHRVVHFGSGKQSDLDCIALAREKGADLPEPLNRLYSEHWWYHSDG